MFKKTGIILCSLLFASSISYAENNSGVYIGGHIGAAGVETTDTDLFATSPINPRLQAPYGNEREIGLAGGVSVGYDFKERYNTPVRLEVNYTARSEATSEKNRGSSNDYLKLKQQTNLQTLMLNLWADIPTNTAFTPYVGGGVGVAFIDYDVNATDYFYGTTSQHYSGSKKTTNFAWSLGGGIAYDVNPEFTVDLGYRFIDAGKVKTDSKPFPGLPGYNVEAETKVKSNELFLEGRYKF